MPKLTPEEIDQLNDDAQYMDDDDSVLSEDPTQYDDEVEDDEEEVVAEAEEEEPEAEADDEADDEDEEPEAEADDEADAEEEPEAEEKEPEAEEPAAEDKGKSKDQLIPKRRYDSAKKRLDHALQQLDELKRNKQSTDAQAEKAESLTSRLDEISDQLNEALTTGDIEAANKLRREERKLTEEVYTLKARQEANTRIETMRYQDTVKTIESQYPELDEDHESFDADLSAEVVDLTEAFEAKGYTPSAALERAVNYVIPSTYAGGPAGDENEGEESNPADEVAAKRRQKSIKRSQVARGKQPPSLKGKGKNSNKAGVKSVTDLIDMPEEDFDAMDLDSEEMKIARGDYD